MARECGSNTMFLPSAPVWIDEEMTPSKRLIVRFGQVLHESLCGEVFEKLVAGQGRVP